MIRLRAARMLRTRLAAQMAGTGRRGRVEVGGRDVAVHEVDAREMGGRRHGTRQPDAGTGQLAARVGVGPIPAVRARAAAMAATATAASEMMTGLGTFCVAEARTAVAGARQTPRRKPRSPCR